MKKAVVTGANGFVGTAVCKELSNNGIKVIAIVRSESVDTSSIMSLDNVEIQVCDLDNIHNLPKLINERDIDCFYHFAWDGTSGSLRSDAPKQINNIKHASNAVIASKGLGCKRFVYAASIMEYEIINTMRENIPPIPCEIYSVAKLCADYICKILARDCGIEYISGLITNIYGPGEISQRFINKTIRKMLINEHCSFTNGEQTYDFIYIDDAAKAFRAIGENGVDGKSYYVGSLNPRPLKEFINTMKNEIDPELSIGLGELPSRLTAMSYASFDINALKKDTGFEPSVSFEDGIRRTISWLKEMKVDGI